MKKYLFLIVVFILILSAAGCQCHRKNTRSKNSIAPTAVIMQKDTFTIKETRWTLIELNGKPLENAGTERSEAYILLDADGITLNGSGGCNSIFGKYELKENNLLTFSEIGMTKMFCVGEIFNEEEMLIALRKTIFYTISGRTLTLFKAVKAPLAKFEFKKDESVK